MSILFASAIAAIVIPVAQVDLAAADVYVSPAARALIEAGTREEVFCVALPERSRKFRYACMTSVDWREAASEAQQRARSQRLDRAEFLAQNFASER